MEDAVIVGAGIAGLATAVALKRVGIRALVLERSDTLRTTGAALTLFPNAWLALDALGVSHKLTSLYSPISGGSVTKVDTGAVQEISFAANIEPRSVHRRALLEALAQELPPDSVKFSAKITTIDVQEQNGASSAVVCLEDGTTIKSKVLIGCDGVHSVVAKWLGLSEPIHSGRSAVRGLAVYPQGHGFKQEVNQFVDVGKRAGFVPLNDKELYWFLSCNEGKDVPKDPEVIQKEIIEKYAVKFPSLYLDVVRHADLSSLTWAPLMLRNPLDMIFGNVNKRNVTVAGDAMHPMTSDLGQGGCLALEDAVVLGRHISNSFIKNGRLVPEEMARALDAYGKERRWRAAWLITGSYLSGWFQQGGSNWLMKFLRDVVFYGFLFRKLSSAVLYDCGTLPAASGDQLHSSNKTD
ncbi:monooxygenase 2 isoform X1 [Ricinus communis]|uniref:Monoxygenase, putative n=1 Tax=Ricinus communis TaxID=3988 RepID=B9SVQ6_RICCO|nr:monooxygenase 2 isoform X1 [Ricinus communis]EEF32315.1 monoxygenase, putative [Ricinus communis]|eukprot:XP_002530075.1 monooxygenase 2 isoform X1 [Ricinus communis]